MVEGVLLLGAGGVVLLLAMVIGAVAAVIGSPMGISVRYVCILAAASFSYMASISA